MPGLDRPTVHSLDRADERLMRFDTNVPTPRLGAGVYFYVPRSNPETMFPALITKVTKREIVLLVPQLGGKGWKHQNPGNLVRFTWRPSRAKWAEKNDGLGLDCVLFPDPETEEGILSTFQSLGGL